MADNNRVKYIGAIIVGAILMAVALIVALVPVKTRQLNYPSCGSVLAPNGGGNFDSSNSLWVSMDNSLYASMCADALAPLRAWAIVLAIVGIAAVAICIIALARTTHAATAQQPDVTSQLKSLHDLHSTGALTEDEYAAAKKRLLATEGSVYGD